MRSLLAGAFLLRRLRAELPGVALIGVLVLGTSLIFAAAPRLFDRAADDALEHHLADAPPVQRSVQLSEVRQLTDEDPMAGIDQEGNDFEAEFPAVVREVASGRDIAVTSARFGLDDPPRYSTFITLRYQSGLDAAIGLVEGRLPASTGDELPPASFGFDPDAPPPPEVKPLFEIAISEATAAETHMAVGQVLDVAADGADPLIAGSLPQRLEARFEVVGIFAVVDASAPEWYADRALQVPTIGGSIESPIAFTTALISPDAVDGLSASFLPFRLHWRYLIDPTRVDGGQLDQLVAGFQRLAAAFPVTASDATAFSGVVMRTGVPGLIAAFRAQRSSAEAVLSVAGAGLLSLAGGAIVMIALLVVSWRRTSLELARGRGASTFLLLGTQAAEGLLIAAPAAALGYLAAGWLIPGRENRLSLWLVVGVCAATVIALVVSTWPYARRISGWRARDDAPVLRVSPRRLVLEGTAVLIAIAGVVLLRQRGLTIGSGGVVRFDPFMAAVPILAGLATGLLVMRLYPLPIRAIGWLAAKRRDIVPILGLRSVGRQSAVLNVPLVVLLLAAAFSTFATVITVSVDRGQSRAAWREVGADYRLDAGQLRPDAAEALAAIDGVEVVTPIFNQAAVGFAARPGQRAGIYLDAVDPDAYDRVTAGSPVAVTWPSAMLGVSGTAEDGLGTEENPIPAIISGELPVATPPMNPGSLFQLSLGGTRLTLRVEEVRQTFPGVPEGIAFVVAPYSALSSVTDSPLPASAYLLRGSAGLEPAIAGAVGLPPGSPGIRSREARYLSMRNAPLVTAIGTGFWLAMLCAAAYAGIAMIAALALSSARRRQDLALLGTLGLTRGQSLGLTAVQHGPPVLLALLPGLALGLIIALALLQSLGLSAFAGDEPSVVMVIDWGSVAVVTVALLLTVGVAIVVGTAAAHRLRPVDSLRLGHD
jgi:putative ABC transport system permease protein